MTMSGPALDKGIGTDARQRRSSLQAVRVRKCEECLAPTTFDPAGPAMAAWGEMVQAVAEGRGPARCTACGAALRVERLGAIAYHHPNPLRRWAVNAWIWLRAQARLLREHRA